MSTPRQLTQTHRGQQLLLRRATIAQLAKLWPALDWARLDSSYPAFAVQVGQLVQANRLTSAGLSAQYLRAFRKANGIPGDLKVILAEPLVVEQFTTSLRVTSVVAAKNAASAGTAIEVAMPNALTLTQGAMSRLVLDAGRETVRATSIADPRCEGWVRVGNGGCEWCANLLDGEVHYVEGYGFDAHDDCRCTAVPAY